MISRDALPSLEVDSRGPPATSRFTRIPHSDCCVCIETISSPYSCVRAFSQARRSGNRLGGDMESQAAMKFTSFASWFAGATTCSPYGRPLLFM